MAILNIVRKDIKKTESPKQDFQVVKRFLQKIRGNEFYKNVLTLFSGSFIAQLIPFLITPILTRLYPADAFGIYVLYSSNVAVPQIFATLQYELAIVLPKRDNEAINMLALSLALSVIISLLLLIIIILFYPWILRLFNLQIGKWLYLIPASVFLQGLFQSFSFWSIRKKDFKVISINRVNKSVSSSVLQVAAGALKFKNFGLIGGMIFGQVVQSCFYIYSIFRHYSQLFRFISRRKIIFVARKYRQIPLLNTVMDLMNTFSNQLPVFLLTPYFGPATVGLYGLAYKVTASPTEIIRVSVKQVFFQNASEIFNNRQDLLAYVKKTYLRLFKISIVPFLILFLISPYVYGPVFGEEWKEAGRYAQILVPWLFLIFLNSPLTSMLTILTRQKIYLVYESVLLVLRFLALWAGYHLYHSILYSLIFYSSVSVIFNVILFFFFLHISRNAYSKNEKNI